MTINTSAIVGPLSLDETTQLLAECVNALPIESVIEVLRDCLDRIDQNELSRAFEPKDHRE